MPYRFVDDAPTADIGFVATGATLEECFTAAADATLKAMLNNPEGLCIVERLPLAAEADSVELALLKALEEMIFHKDARGAFLRLGNISISAIDEKDGQRWSVRGTLEGEPIDRDRHELANDVKAVTLHQLRVHRTEVGWEARVVLDV